METPTFVALTRVDGKIVFVQPHLVTTIAPHHGVEGHSTVTMVGSGIVHVQNTPEEVAHGLTAPYTEARPALPIQPPRKR